MSFWDAFTGKGARKDIDKGISAVNAGTDKAVGAFEQYGNQARGELTRYRDEGGRAFTLHNDSAGVNGVDARQSAQDLYLTDDLLRQERERAIKRNAQASNAGGGYVLGADGTNVGSGVGALADSRTMLENYGSWQNRLAGIGQQGQQAATTTAGIDQNTGAGIAGSYQNAGAQTANLYGQRAQTQNALAQNLIGIAGVAASAYGGGNYGINRLGQGSAGKGGR